MPSPARIAVQQWSGSNQRPKQAPRFRFPFPEGTALIPHYEQPIPRSVAETEGSTRNTVWKRLGVEEFQVRPWPDLRQNLQRRRRVQKTLGRNGQDDRESGCTGKIDSRAALRHQRNLRPL